MMQASARPHTLGPIVPLALLTPTNAWFHVSVGRSSVVVWASGGAPTALCSHVCQQQVATQVQEGVVHACARVHLLQVGIGWAGGATDVGTVWPQAADPQPSPPADSAELPSAAQSVPSRESATAAPAATSVAPRPQCPSREAQDERALLEERALQQDPATAPGARSGGSSNVPPSPAAPPGGGERAADGQRGDEGRSGAALDAALPLAADPGGNAALPRGPSLGQLKVRSTSN